MFKGGENQPASSSLGTALAQKVQKVEKGKWYRDGLRFECTQCGNCCSGDPGFVWATKDEIGRISEFLGRDDDWLDRKHLRRVGLRYSLTEKANGDCIFLKREKGKSLCSIYEVRPVQCRTWPFWSSNLKSRTTWQEAAKTCPGLNQGRKRDFVQWWRYRYGLYNQCRV
ncbi:MAG: YkgJ family cysteine cluster protein [Planctomycetes bacterium]|nr:YkgJ family cysteine cluster protein [Planctomycetota bacterium]